MKKFSPFVSILLTVALVSFASAQVTYSDPVITSYQVANLGSQPATIVVNYYDENGAQISYAPQFPNVPVGGSVTVQQALEGQLPSGHRYSAVVSSDQQVAAVVNQQLGTVGSGTSIAPFSSYSGFSAGSQNVVLPAIMSNWFGYYTEIYVQNTGNAAAQNISITYTPTSIGSCTTGSALTDPVATNTTPLPQNSSTKVTQFGKTALGAPSVPGCTAYTGRFLGSAKITADQPVAVVVNEIVQDKLFTYNGFAAGGTTLLVPAYMRNYFGYYASLTIANTDPVNSAEVKLTYTADSQFSSPPNTVITANHTIPGGKSITIYDGKTATAAESDLLGTYPWDPTKSDTKQPLRFFGTVKVEALNAIPVVATVNQEAVLAAGNQAGSYNAMASSEGTKKIAIPLIQSDYYGYYTSLTIMTVDGTEASVKITYTSDGTYSAKKNFSKSYTMSTVNGFLNRYEGPYASPAQSDLLDDLDWEVSGVGRFIGSAVIEVVSGPNIVAFVNAESNTAPYASTRDSMYTYNGFNITP